MNTKKRVYLALEVDAATVARLVGVFGLLWEKEIEDAISEVKRRPN